MPLLSKEILAGQGARLPGSMRSPPRVLQALGHLHVDRYVARTAVGESMRELHHHRPAHRRPRKVRRRGVALE